MTQENEMDGEMNPKFGVDDWVRWDWSTGTARGQIESVHTDGPVSVSGTERDPSEKGEPVYKIKHYDKMQGSFGNMKIAYESNLNTANDPRENETTTDSCTECSYGPCSCGRHVSLTIDAVVDAESLDELDLTPPQSAQEAAQTALDLREETDAMTDVGWNTAEMLAAGEEIPPSKISDGQDGMANWWPRHEDDIVSSDGESLKRNPSDSEDREYVPKANDNSWVAGKGWGGIPGMNWAMRMDEKITEIRNEMKNDSTVKFADESTIQDTITYDGLMGGKVDESAIPNPPDHRQHYVFDAETKTDSSYELVDGDGNLRRGNVKAAWELYGKAEDESLLLDVLAQANNEFADADGYSAPIPEDSLTEAMTDSFTDMTIQEFIDDNDLSTEDVIDQLGIETPDSPTDFYDSEPDVETLVDDFTAVEALVDSKESLEDDVAELNDELQSYRVEDFRDTAERLAELVESREVDEMVEQFEDGELTVNDVEQQITVAEEAIGSTTTTVNTDSDVKTDNESETLTDSSSTISTVDRDKIQSTDSGKLDLSTVRN